MKICSAGPEITPDEIAALERRLKLVLPDDYRRFLLTYNGGRPDPGYFDVPGHRETPFHVHSLLGMRRPIESSQIEWNREVCKLIPPHLLVIGRTDTGDLICLEYEGNRVWFWDSLAEDDGLYCLERTFQEFLNSLHDAD